MYREIGSELIVIYRTIFRAEKTESKSDPDSNAAKAAIASNRQLMSKVFRN